MAVISLWNSGRLVSLTNSLCVAYFADDGQFFLKRGASRRSGVRDAVLYALSIVVVYVGLGLIVALLFGADALNTVATNAWVNILFFVLFVVFALSFFGLFEIQLPGSWSTALNHQAEKTKDSSVYS